MIKRTYFIRLQRYRDGTPVAPSWSVREWKSIFPQPLRVVDGYIEQQEKLFPGEQFMVEEFRRV